VELGAGIDQNLDCSDWSPLINSCVGNWSKMVQQVLIAAVLHIVRKIWIERNERYFNNKVTSIEKLIRTVIVEIGCSFQSIQDTTSSMLDLKISHLFHLPLKQKPMSNRFTVCWHPPPPEWTKINIDGSNYSSPYGSIGGVSEIRSVISLAVLFRILDMRLLL
jgi:hypothetical protein